MPPVFTDKYTSRSTSFSDKYSPRNTSFSDRFEPKWGFILQESLSFLLLEDGGKIIREEQIDYADKYV